MYEQLTNPDLLKNLFKVLEIVCSRWTQLKSTRRHYFLTIIIVTASVILSLSTDCLGIVLELNVSHFG